MVRRYARGLGLLGEWGGREAVVRPDSGGGGAVAGFGWT